MRIERSSKSVLFTVVSFSAGRQSSWFLEKMLRGEVDVYLPHVLNVNPGMENQQSLASVEQYRERCREKNIYFETVPSPNLYEDLINGKCREHPPYFTAEGGMIQHHCTREYKIYPLRRAIRSILRTRFHVRRTWGQMVDSMICFGAEETHRVKETRPDVPAYEVQRYPLIEMGVDTNRIGRDFAAWGLPMPTPSLCNGCFANGLEAYSKMGKFDMDQAIDVDSAVRDQKFSGLTCSALYCSNTMIPLEQLQKQGFKLETPEKTDKHRCNSGVCFV